MVMPIPIDLLQRLSGRDVVGDERTVPNHGRAVAAGGRGEG